MTEPTGHEIAELLQAWREGDERALEKLTPEVYRELHSAARRCMARERDGHTLQTTALINELYLRLSDLREVDWQNRAHFFALCARQMRRILTDMARNRQSEKRGGGAFTVALDEAPEVACSSHSDVIVVDDALKALALIDERKSRVVELRFFGGLSVEETAEVLKVSPDTVARDWRLAKAWLLREMSARPMDPERWQRIESIFQKALDADEDRRTRVLAESCAGDESLRREVESLLAQHEHAAEFMERPAFAGPEGAPVPPRPGSEDSHSAGIPAGTVIGHYRIVGKIGSGGMGVVYDAEDLKLRRHVALKFLPEEVAGQPRVLQRFRLEAQAASALNHPNICTIHEVDEVDGLVFIVMELLEGQTLKQTISGKSLPLETVIDFGVQIAGAIDAAHAKGVVHRDIKPANIFVMKQRRIKVLDFGLAKLTRLPPNFEETGMTDGTEPGMVMGTVGYMSPEQLRGQGVDGRTDIFAFGAILYEMLAGRRAFEKPASAETMAAILNEEPPAISELAPNTPPDLVRIVKRCLEKDPEQRFQSASDLAFALEALSRRGYRFVAELEPPAQIDAGSDGETRNERLREERGKRFRRWLLLAGAVLAVVLTPIWYLRRPLPPLHVSGYAQITHDGSPKFAMGTDGIRLYLNVYPDSSPPAQVAISGGEITRVPMALPNPWVADVSPDGSTLLVSTDPDPGGPQRSIWSVQVLGPSLRHLTDGHFFPYATSAAWSPDGKSVVFSTTNGDINVMGNDGTRSHTVANLPYRTEDVFRPRIAWSPDGITIRFDRNKRIYEMKPDGSGLHPFLPGWRPSFGMCCGQWTPDGKFFEFLLFDPVSSMSSNMPPASQIWALDERRGPFWRAPAEPVQLTSGPTRWNRPIPGKDGKKIFATGSTPNGELVRMDAKSGQLLPYLGGISAEDVTFSPDSRFIA